MFRRAVQTAARYSARAQVAPQVRLSAIRTFASRASQQAKRKPARVIGAFVATTAAVAYSQIDQVRRECKSP
jgi:hypothetical protein